MSNVYIFPNQNSAQCDEWVYLWTQWDKLKSGLSWEILSIWLLSANGLFLKEPNTSMAKELHSFTIPVYSLWLWLTTYDDGCMDTWLLKT